MADVLYRDPDLEWLDHVQPVGLVVAPTVLKELGLTPLHQSPVDTAETAERLRRTIREHVFLAGDREVHVTVSVGVASYPSASVDSPATLIREADQALYRAKEAGRDLVA